MRDLLEHRRLVITITLLYLSQGIPIGIAMDAMRPCCATTAHRFMHWRSCRSSVCRGS
ncbi:hypothetical protein CSX04_05893 [Burkholderia cepacia]|nr:hypothetical protein CSX04_05893 [Burkholderia cepacia]